MRFWFVNRAVPLVLIVTIMAAVLCIPATGLLVALPNLAGGPQIASPLSALLPLASVIAYGSGLARQNAQLEESAIRRVRALDIALATLCILLFCVALAVQPGAEMLEAVRNAAGYFGATLLCARFLNLNVASLVPLFWAVLSAMGILPLGNPLTSWPMEPGASPSSWAVPMGMALVGPIVYLNGSARPTRRLALRSISRTTSAQHLPNIRAEG